MHNSQRDRDQHVQQSTKMTVNQHMLSRDRRPLRIPISPDLQSRPTPPQQMVSPQQTVDAMIPSDVHNRIVLPPGTSKQNTFIEPSSTMPLIGSCPLTKSRQTIGSCLWPNNAAIFALQSTVSHHDNIPTATAPVHSKSNGNMTNGKQQSPTDDALPQPPTKSKSTATRADARKRRRKSRSLQSTSPRKRQRTSNVCTLMIVCNLSFLWCHLSAQSICIR